MTLTFEQIYKQYYNNVIKNLCGKGRIKDRMVAEELASDVMVKVYKSLHTYDEGQSKLSTWIYRIATNTLIDYYRKRQLQTVPLEQMYADWTNGEEEAQIDHLMVIKDREMNPEDSLIEKEVSEHMFKLFETLNEVEKLVASLHYFDSFSYDEIAEELNMPLGTVKAKLHSARVTMMKAVPVEMRRVKTIA